MSWELLDSAHLSPLEMVSMIELVLITNAVVNDGFDCGITDHKCLKVTLKLK
jgi:hypothetical protein